MKQKGDPLTAGKQFALRHELGKLSRNSRIARTGALYGASVSGRTFETIGETTINPIDLEEVVDVNVSKVLGANSYPRVPRFEGTGRNFPKSANLVNL